MSWTSAALGTKSIGKPIQLANSLIEKPDRNPISDGPTIPASKGTNVMTQLTNASAETAFVRLQEFFYSRRTQPRASTYNWHEEDICQSG